MTKYNVHSNNGSGEVRVRLIENGIIVTHTHIGSAVDVYFETVEQLNEWLITFYRKAK